MTRQYISDPDAVEGPTVTDNTVEGDGGAEAMSCASGGLGVVSRRAFDRAEVVTTNIMHMITTAVTKEQLKQTIEDCLHDEFADVTRQTAAERASDDG